MSVEVIHSPLLAGVSHGFLGRRGGISTGPLASLNTGYGSKDERSAIDENRRLATAAIAPGAALVTVHQVHSAAVVHALEPWPLEMRPHADAMVTDRPGLLLAILTADCAPVLLADSQSGVIGAAHAGWRGALGGVIEATIAAMEDIGARRNRIRAAVGPCIAQPSYEVDLRFRDCFLAADADNQRYFVHGPGAKPHFDLPGYVLRRLEHSGVAEAAALHIDTYADENGYYSFRRSTHRGEADYGRQLSGIALP